MISNVAILGSSNRFGPSKDIPDLSGKIYIVTGGSPGIGHGISGHILQQNHAGLYLLGKREKHPEVDKGLKQYGHVGCVEFVQYGFEDLRQTDKFGKQLVFHLERLDALGLNAGLGVGPYSERRAI